MKEIFGIYETNRLLIQESLDKQKTSAERNKLGQFATPTKLAREILSYGLSLLPENEKIDFLDPAFGTGSFFSALLETIGNRSINSAQGYEIDPHYGEPSRQLWKNHQLKIHLTDFTNAPHPEQGFNLLICNPPYVRHHHLKPDEKVRLQIHSRFSAGVNLSGLSGLYCYFMALAHMWMKEGGVAGWLVPSEFMDVKYGREIKQYLLTEVTLLRVHRFNPSEIQFNDALVSSAVVWFKKARPNSNHSVNFTFGGSHKAPAIAREIPISELFNETKWTRFPSKKPRIKSDDLRLVDIFDIKRGLATGNNKFFILTNEEINRLALPKECFRPILPSPRYIDADEIFADAEGNPVLPQQLFLLDCRLKEDQVKSRYPKLWDYLETGKEDVASTYLCKSRKVWYWQEERKPSPLVCTYMGRGGKHGRPFRFILNHSKAIVANTYLILYPKSFVADQILSDSKLLENIWYELNRISSEKLISEGRVYGGGLHKMEPKELANLHIGEISKLLKISHPTTC